MNVMRFAGKNSSEAMRKLRAALGPDALVLANRPCAEGIELLAAAPDALQTLPSVATAPEPESFSERGESTVPAEMSTVSFQDYVRQRVRERNQRSVAPAPMPERPSPPSVAPELNLESFADAEPAARPLSRAPGTTATFLNQAPRSLAESMASDDGFLGSTGSATAPVMPTDGQALLAEVQALKGMITAQFATVGWFEGVRRSPVQGKLLRTLVGAGFSLKLARSLLSKLPSDYGEQDAQIWLEQVLVRNIRCAEPDQTFEAGGIFALIGPTGVGKTTTTAKIAARQVLKHGAASVALITVDTYRLGAHDQLRAFGRILGVPVHIAHDAEALHDLLRLRASRQLVLVDTVGMGHRDPRIRSLLGSLPRTDIHHVVVANSAAQAETLDESLRAYEARQAAGVILTKVDEAARIGGAIDCLLRQRLKLLGVCDGQRVPEDWHAPDATQWVRRSLQAASPSAFGLEDEELPLVFGVAATLQGSLSHA